MIAESPAGPLLDDAEREIVERFHPLANIIPMRSDRDVRAYAEEMRRGELRPTVTMFENKILDGRATALACHRAGVPPTEVPYEGVDPVRHLLVKNGNQRHLTERQKVMIAARSATAPVGSNQYSEGVPVGVASNLLGVKERSVQRAKAVLTSGIPELVSMLEQGKISLVRAEEVAKLDDTGQLEELTNPTPALPTKRKGAQSKSSGLFSKRSHRPDQDDGAAFLVPGDAEGTSQNETQHEVITAVAFELPLNAEEDQLLNQLETLWDDCSLAVRTTFLRRHGDCSNLVVRDATDFKATNSVETGGGATA